jgi:hypothetical protein
LYFALAFKGVVMIKLFIKFQTIVFVDKFLPLCRFELETDDEDYEAFRKEKLRAKEREADLEILHNSMFS